MIIFDRKVNTFKSSCILKIEILAGYCYYFDVEKSITEAVHVDDAGDPKSNVRSAGANHQVMKGYSFVPSPSANLVGVEKKAVDQATTVARKV